MENFVESSGNWCQMLRPGGGKGRPDGASRPGLFFDRDGVLLVDKGYVHRPDQVVLLPGAGSVVRQANDLGMPTVIVTNQSGIGRGFFGWDDFAATQAQLLDLLARENAFIDMVLACPFHPDAKPPYRVADHPYCKPNPGMVLRAAELLPIDLSRSWIIGDRERDLRAGRAASLAGGLLVGAVPSDPEAVQAGLLAAPDFDVRILSDLSAAMQLDLWPGKAST